MKMLEFFETYPNEESCKEAFKQMRLKEAVNCKRCGNTAHYWKKIGSNGNVRNVIIEPL